MPSAEQPYPDQLRAESLSVYLGQRLALNQVSFNAPRGSITSVLGPNGSGKTTLLRALVGLVPHTGHVHLADQKLSQLSAIERARLISYVPQRSLMNAAIPVVDVVAQGRFCHHGGWHRRTAQDRAAIARVIEEVDLRGYEQRSYNALSGGEQRRVLLARALATEAPVILLDEPTAALDIRHALELHARLRTLANAGHAIVVVLHHIDDALRFADHVTLLRAGQLVMSGSVATTLTHGNIKALYGVHVIEQAGLRFALEEPGTHAAS